MKKSYYIATGIFVLLIVGLFAVPAYFNRSQRENVQGADATNTSEELVEAYVRENISELSPEKAVVGGTFYVTDIIVRDGRGVVSYEDGHIALVADFTYEVSSDGEVAITSFVATVAQGPGTPPSDADILK